MIWLANYRLAPRAHLFPSDVKGTASVCRLHVASKQWKVVELRIRSLVPVRPGCPTCVEYIESPVLRLRPHRKVMEALQRLQAHGLFGETIERVAEGLLLEALRDKIDKGWTR